MKKLLGLFVIASMLLFFFDACVKKEFREDLFIRGRLFVHDPVNGLTADTALPKQAVLLASGADGTQNYLNSDTTDAEGYFEFNLLASETTSYEVRFEGKINGLFYTGTQKVAKGENNVQLIAELSNVKQNGYHLVVQNPAGQPASFAQVRVFNTEMAYNADTGKIRDEQTDLGGVINHFNVNAGRYYFRAEFKVGAITMYGMDFVEVGTTGVKSKTIQLSTEPKNGYEITILDNSTFHSPVSKADVYLYKSFSTFDLDSVYTESDLHFQTDEAGKATRYNIPSAQYFVRAVKTIGTSKLTGSNTLDITPAGVVKLPITIK